MEYVVIENFNRVISLVTDEEGETFVTEDFYEAKGVASECQEGIVVPLKPFEECNKKARCNGRALFSFVKKEPYRKYLLVATQPLKVLTA